jgi:hypothetical protein
MARALMLHDLVSKHRQSQLGSSDLEPTSPFVVAFDTVERIAAHVTKMGGKLYYRGYPVLSVGNVNLLAELVRKGVVERHKADYDVGLRTSSTMGASSPDSRQGEAASAGTGDRLRAYQALEHHDR